jgi:hypothetical protein
MWDRSEVGVRSLHSDSLRARQLRAMVTDDVVVFCVSNSTGIDPGSLSTIQCDVRRMKSWTTNHRFGAGSIPGRGVNYFFLDYFWLPPIYYDPHDERNDEGYGGRWFSHILPGFFAHGGLIAILPNDYGGFLKRMATASPGICTTFLSVEDALVCHPLFMATHALTCDDLLVGASNRHGGARTNESSVRQWLDPVYPFYLAFNVLLVPAAEEARRRLVALFK